MRYILWTLLMLIPTSLFAKPATYSPPYKRYDLMSLKKCVKAFGLDAIEISNHMIRRTELGNLFRYAIINLSNWTGIVTEYQIILGVAARYQIYYSKFANGDKLMLGQKARLFYRRVASQYLVMLFYLTRKWCDQNHKEEI